MTRRQRARTMRSVFLGLGGGAAAAIPLSAAHPNLQITLAIVSPVLLAVGGAQAAGEFNDPEHNRKAPANPPAQ